MRSRNLATIMDNHASVYVCHYVSLAYLLFDAPVFTHYSVYSGIQLRLRKPVSTGLHSFEIFWRLVLPQAPTKRCRMCP